MFDQRQESIKVSRLYAAPGDRRTIDSTEVAATGFQNGYFTCRDIGESGRYVIKIGPTQMTDASNKSHSSEQPVKLETKVVAMLGGFGGLGLTIGKGIGESINGSLGGWIGLGVGSAVGALLGYAILRSWKSSLPFHPTVSCFVAMGVIVAIVSAIGHLFAGVTGGWIALSACCVLAFLYGFAKRPRTT